jgi:hypothetical protein
MKPGNCARSMRISKNGDALSTNISCSLMELRKETQGRQEGEGLSMTPLNSGTSLLLGARRRNQQHCRSSKPLARTRPSPEASYQGNYGDRRLSDFNPSYGHQLAAKPNETPSNLQENLWLSNSFQKIDFFHVLRQLNGEADQAAKAATPLSKGQLSLNGTLFFDPLP